MYHKSLNTELTAAMTQRKNTKILLICLKPDFNICFVFLLLSESRKVFLNRIIFSSF